MLTNNDVIINFCLEKSFKLLTASFDMAIRAKFCGVEVEMISIDSRNSLKYNFEEILKKLENKN